MFFCLSFYLIDEHIQIKNQKCLQNPSVIIDFNSWLIVLLYIVSK